MTGQYEEFNRYVMGASLQHQAHFNKERTIARKYMMDSNSFLVSLRRRGFDLALQDIGVTRTIIDENYRKGQADFFPAQVIVEVIEPESKWSTANSR